MVAHGDAALAQYGGEFLPGSYDDWLLETRSELERQCADLCDMLSAAKASAGDLAGAVAAARRRIQLQPLEEVGYRTLMRLQADVGDRAGALSTYHHCASVLERELGVVPDPATQEMLGRLMSPAERPAGQRQPVLAPTPAGRPGAGAAHLVGRARELGVLRDSWQRAAAGRSGAGRRPRRRRSRQVQAGGRGQPSWRGHREPLSRAPSASPRPAGSRSLPLPTGSGIPRSGHRSRHSTRPGGSRSTGSCRPVAARATTSSAPGRWWTPGSGTGSSRGWPAR